MELIINYDVTFALIIEGNEGFTSSYIFLCFDLPNISLGESGIAIISVWLVQNIQKGKKSKKNHDVC